MVVKKSDENDDLTCWYAVAWIDLMGQSDVLNQIKELPAKDDDPKEFLEPRRNSIRKSMSE